MSKTSLANQTESHLPDSAQDSLDSLAGSLRPEVAEPTPGLRIHFWFGVITLIYAIDFADRFLINAILPHLKAEFGLSDAQSGLIGGIVYLGLLLLAVPSGALVDRWSRKGMITLMTIVWSIATWTTGLANSFNTLLLSRVAVGAGEAGYNPAGYALIAAWYPKRLRGLMIGFFNAAQPIGGGLGIALAAWIADHWGWRHVFGIMAAPGLVLGLLAWFAPDYKTRKAEDNGIEVRGSFREALQYIQGSRTLLLLLAAQLPVSFYLISWGVWSTSFFTRTFHLPASQASTAVFAAITVAAFGPPFGGWLSDRLVRKHVAGRLFIGIGALAILLVLHVALFVGSGNWISFKAAIVLASVAQFFMAAHWGALVTASLDLTPPQFRGSAQSFLPLAQGLVAFWAAALTGWISDHLGLAQAMTISVVLGVGGAIFLIISALSSYAKDDQRRKDLGEFRIDIGGGI
jgi:MFS family permease